VEYLEELRSPGQLFVEPFCGGLSITSRVKGPIVANDRMTPLISLYNALMEGWEPPEYISQETYLEARNYPDTVPVKAFIGVGCSYSGKWFGGYARGEKGRNYALNAKRSLMKKIGRMPKNTLFTNTDYRSMHPHGSLIYADPPYAGTTQYSGERFDTEEFWGVMDLWARRGNTVVVSEYSAPSDVEELAQFSKTIGLRTSSQGNEKRQEKLFIIRAKEDS
jgi:DNA adenine methylase